MRLLTAILVSVAILCLDYQIDQLKKRIEALEKAEQEANQ